MGESIGIDSLLGGWAMPKAYSGEMRERVIAEVESGASRREAAEEFAISASTAVIWVRQTAVRLPAILCLLIAKTTSSSVRSGCFSIRPNRKSACFSNGELLPPRGSAAQRPVCRKHLRFFKRHKISFKKKPARSGSRGRGAGAPALDARTGHV